MIFKSLKERFLIAKRAIKNRSVMHLLTKVFYMYWFDIKYSLDTSSFKFMHELEIESENKEYGIVYMPTDYQIFRNVFKKLNCNFEKFTFVDFGCGKGKVLLLASDYGFKKLKGIEFSKELCDICTHNINKFQKRKKELNIQVIFNDCAEYNIDPEDNFFYFYNPFESVVFKRVLDNIDQSILKYKRKVFIVYIKPLCSNLFINRPYKILYNIKNDAIIYTNET